MGDNESGVDGQPRRVIRNVCVFCGSSLGVRPEYKGAAEALGRELSRLGIGLVYGGGRVGLMGVLADAVLAAGGKAVGVIPRALEAKEIAHSRLTQLHVVGSMHERKALMADLADAFVLLPGGFGSWDEFCEVLTWSQLGIHDKPCGLLNVRAYYDPLLALAAHATAEGFVGAAHEQMIVVETDPARLLGRLSTAAAVAEVKWTDATSSDTIPNR